MPTQPFIRGFMSRTILDAARNLPAEKQRRIFSLVPKQVISLIESTPRLGWVPFEENMKLSDSMHQVLGSPGFRDVFASISDRMMSYPLLQTFFDGAMRLFGPTPQALLKWTTYSWDHVFKECGKITYQPRKETADGGRAEMVLEGFPSTLMRTGTFVESLAGTFDMYLRRVSKKGQVEIRGVDVDRGYAMYDISWD